MQADLFAWLRDVIGTGQLFDVVVLDPAKQTRDREEIDYALKRYLRHEPPGPAGGGAGRHLS